MMMGIWVTLIGSAFMVFSIFIKEIGGGISGGGPTAPAEPAHKVVFFLVGLASFIKGTMMLFH